MVQAQPPCAVGVSYVTWHVCPVVGLLLKLVMFLSLDHLSRHAVGRVAKISVSTGTSNRTVATTFSDSLVSLPKRVGDSSFFD